MSKSVSTVVNPHPKVYEMTRDYFLVVLQKYYFLTVSSIQAPTWKNGLETCHYNNSNVAKKKLHKDQVVAILLLYIILYYRLLT